MTIYTMRARQSEIKGLHGYCLYKDGQLVPPQEAVPTAQPLPQSVQEPQPQNTANTTDSNGQCCPQPNPISINITNSQDTNSRNTNTSRQANRVPHHVVRPQPIRALQQVRAPQQVRASRHGTAIQRVPVYRTLIQRVPYPVIRKVPIEVIKQVEVIKRVEVPVEVIKQVEIPVLRNTYTERIIGIPVTGCEGKEFIYPSWT